MNIYDFFNSPDVAKHCQDLGHEFNAIESAVMINQCRTRTLAEKHAAYRAIIAEYPDMKVKKGINHGYHKSFHKALGGVIAHEERVLEKFLMPEPGAVYRVQIFYREWDSPSWSAPFSTFENAVAEALESIKDEYEFAANYSIVRNIDSVDIYKEYFDCDNYISAQLSSAGEVLCLNYNGVIEYDENVLLLDSFYIDVPVPFKAGDLVEVVDVHSHKGNVYVLKNIVRDDPGVHKKLLKGYNDTSDMVAGIYYESEGTVHCDCIHFYPDLRYCRRPLEGNERILKYVSMQERGEICLCTLLKAQEYLRLDKKICGLRNDFDFKYDVERVGEKL